MGARKNPSGTSRLDAGDGRFTSGSLWNQSALSALDTDARTWTMVHGAEMKGDSLYHGGSRFPLAKKHCDCTMMHGGTVSRAKSRTTHDDD